MRERFRLSQPDSRTVARLVERGLVGRPLPQFQDVYRLANEGYRRNVVVYGCIKLRMTTAAQVDLVAESVNRRGEGEPLGLSHPLQQLLDRPNPEQSQDEWLQQWILNYDVAGANYSHKVRSRAGGVVELWNLPPQNIEIVPDALGFINTFDLRVEGDSKRIPVPFDEVIHHKELDPLDPYYGLSKIAVLARQGDIDNEACDYIRAVLLNSGVPAHGLKVKGKMGPEERDSIRLKWRENYGRATRGAAVNLYQWGRGVLGIGSGTDGSGGWGDVAVLDEDFEYFRIGQIFSEMDLGGIFGHSESRLCTPFGIPPILIGSKVGLDKATYSNAEQAEDFAWNNTFVPMWTAIAKKLTHELAPEYGENVRIVPDFSQVRALKEDENARSERARNEWNDGLLRMDEAREAIGREPIKDTDDDGKVIGQLFTWQIKKASTPNPMLPPSNGNGGDPRLISADTVPNPPDDDDDDDDEQEKQSLRLALPADTGDQPDEPIWKDLHRAADEKAMAIRRAVSEAFSKSKTELGMNRLANALLLNDSMTAEQEAIRAFKAAGEPILNERFRRTMSELFSSGARAGGRELPKELESETASGDGPKEVLAELPDEQGQAWAETRVAELVVDISGATRELIRSVVEEMFAEGGGFSARVAATRIRDRLGLTKPLLQRLNKYEKEQTAKGVLGEVLARRLQSYSRRLIRFRALQIARTEGIRAVSEGQSAIWDAALRQGILPPDQMQEWLTVEDERTCKICAPMDGQKQPVGKPFTTGTGGSVMAPPAHPACRCARGLK